MLLIYRYKNNRYINIKKDIRKKKKNKKEDKKIMLINDEFLSNGLQWVGVGGSILSRKGKGKNHLYLYI